MKYRVNSSELASKLIQDPSSKQVFGTQSSLEAYTITHWAKHQKRNFLIICPTQAYGDELVNDLELTKQISDVDLDILQLPTWTHSPYLAVAPSIQTRLERSSSLFHLLKPRKQIIMVSTLEGLCHAAPPAHFFLNHSFELRKDSRLDRSDLEERLINAGYLKTETVEDEGTFAIRGEIVDVFPIGRSKPVRMEFFDDELEKMRDFDPANQRTSQLDEHLSLWVSPAREVLITSETYSGLRNRLKRYADEAGISRRDRDPILDQIRPGIYADHSDTWANFCFEKTTSALDYLDPSWAFVWKDHEQSMSNLATLKENLRSDFANMAASLIVPPPERLYLFSKIEEEKLLERHHLLFEPLEFQTTTESFRFEFDVPKPKTNYISAANEWLNEKKKLVVFCQTKSQEDRVRHLLDEETGKHVLFFEGTLTEGFIWHDENIVVLNDFELLGETRRQNRKRGKKSKNWDGLQILSDLGEGDLVVHREHGVGRYLELKRLKVLDQSYTDFILLKYNGNDRLYIPVYHLNSIQKYNGPDNIALDKLGSQKFEQTKARVKSSVKKMALDLVGLYAQRKKQKGVQFNHRDEVYEAFEAEFPFSETDDQLKALEDCFADLEQGQLMDRLICGDVGFGKTEIAIRVAFQAVMNGLQVCVLVPTTLLAQQHENTFRERLRKQAVTVESISRLKSRKEQKEILEKAAKGKVDILIGTHRILSKDVKFSRLGLLVVDEEHRFGVEHKEKLKALKVDTHVLTLTATPIPRTLHMVFSGVRDITVMQTPPVDRLPIKTFVSPTDETVIKNAIETELSRGGQIFFVHNRVQNIYKVADDLKKLVPSAKVAVGHGQLSEAELEKTMLSFYQKKTNLLVCTTIIESGLDVPSANTIIIDRADQFGLAQLYQMRGRVGRSSVRAFAYLLVKKEKRLTEEAKRRLEVIQRFVELGSGFQVASHDLEIRGGGNLLGPEQSGNIAAVGFDFYLELLENAVKEVKGEEIKDSPKDPEIKTPFSSFLDKSYVSDPHQRLLMYKRLAVANSEDDLTDLEKELKERFGPIPSEAENLIWILRIKLVLKEMDVESLTVGKNGIVLTATQSEKFTPEAVMNLVGRYPDQYSIRPESRLLIHQKTNSLTEIYTNLTHLRAELLICEGKKA